jgi:AraC family transcriptional regulator, regulatory protein of adaptative response / methylated-DNA-[protein]-cysteine methyltransferase
MWPNISGNGTTTTHAALPAALLAAPPGDTIRYGFARTSVGLILAAASPRGLCALLLADEPGVMLTTLRREFSRSRCLPTDDASLLPMARIRDLLEQSASAEALDLALDLRGTEFQQRVWRVLLTIPAGETLSYAALAARLGMPRGSRAVAAACAANRIAVAVPCHRVVRSDGSPSGYRWGAKRKLALLERERRRSG